MLAKFGVMEVCRTGRISLKRGEELLENMMRAPGESSPAKVDRWALVGGRMGVGGVVGGRAWECVCGGVGVWV